MRFDRNDYSVPHTHVRRSVTVHASLTTVRVLDGTEVVAQHPRSFDRGQQIEHAPHVEALVAEKRAARAHRGVDRLTAAVPRTRELLTQAAARGEPLGTCTTRLLRLLDAYGARELDGAVADALSRGVPHPNAVELALQRRREARGAPPPLALPLSDAVRRRDPHVRPHALDRYDDLTTPSTPESDDDQPE